MGAPTALDRSSKFKYLLTRRKTNIGSIISSNKRGARLQRVIGRDLIIEQLSGVRDRREAERRVIRLAAHWIAVELLCSSVSRAGCLS